MQRSPTNDPVPIDHGSVRQIVVRYSGLRRGAVGFRGPRSGRTYSFDATSSGSTRYVQAEDVEHFRRLSDFVARGNVDASTGYRWRREDGSWP